MFANGIERSDIINRGAYRIDCGKQHGHKVETGQPLAGESYPKF